MEISKDDKRQLVGHIWNMTDIAWKGRDHPS